MEGAGAVLRRPLGWGGVLLAGALGMIMTFSYLGGFLDPIHHLHGLKVAVVSTDRPVDVAGTHVAGGEQVVHGLFTSGRREVTFVHYPSRQAALDAIHADRVIGAVVVPQRFSAQIAQVGVTGGSAPPARLELISNDGAGLFQAQVFATLRLEVDDQVNASANRQIVAVLAHDHVKIDPAGAAHVGRPVSLATTDAVSVAGKTGRGLAPFYAAVMATLTGFLATSVASLMVDVLRGTEHLELLGRQVSTRSLQERPRSTWIAKAVLSVSGACLGGLAIATTAVTILGMHGVHFWPMAGLAALGASAIALVALIFLTLFGIGGELLGVLFTTIFGVPSALGVYPAQALPPFFRFVSSWHPMHYLTDGMRSLTFYGGRADAGLGTALAVLAAWLVGAGLVGFGVAWGIERRAFAPVGLGVRDRALRTVLWGRPGLLPAHLRHLHPRVQDEVDAEPEGT